jgi:hypothetical protein
VRNVRNSPLAGTERVVVLSIFILPDARAEATLTPGELAVGYPRWPYRPRKARVLVGKQQDVF